MTLTAPQVPGNYIAFFRFVHGDNLRFGQKVWCDILVQAAPQVPKQAEPHEERSSLLNESLEADVPAAIDFKFEMVSAPEQKQPAPFEVVSPQKPAENLALSHFEEHPMHEEVKMQELPQVVASDNEEEEESSLKLSQPSQDELDKIRYLEKLSQVKDPKVVENLQYIYDMGYTNFEVNLSLLKRNNNELIIAINHLCNGIVSESMFQQQQ